MEGKILDLYKIEGTENLDSHSCFSNPDSFPQFQEGLDIFKSHIKQLVNDKESKTFYKFGDGDYRFLTAQEVGSAKPGIRALSLPYSEIDLQAHRDGANKCDFYTCEIYPENRKMFAEVIGGNIDYPAEYGYGLVANRWLISEFESCIGLVGAKPKLMVVEELMKYSEYQDYLGLEKFTDYIHFPQKFAADDLNELEKFVRPQLEKSTSRIFLVGIGHAKSGILHKFSEWKPNSVFLDIGAGIDMIAGCINIRRPYAGDWTNYRIKNYDYSNIDYLRYSGEGKHEIL
jgi:hypothetical protein|tara:strand:+ start:1570 stop:2430 length:861 start_codon:yes stop_codon:yes gene_type:complete